MVHSWTFSGIQAGPCLGRPATLHLDGYDLAVPLFDDVSLGDQPERLGAQRFSTDDFAFGNEIRDERAVDHQPRAHAATAGYPPSTARWT